MIQSQRQLRVGEQIKVALVESLRKGKVADVRLMNNEVTITRVKISADLQIADCYFLPFIHNRLTENEWLSAFEASKYGLRAQVTDKVALKYSPELKFHYDHGFDNAENINKLLKAVL